MGCVFRRLPITLSLTFYQQGAFDSFEHEHLPRTKYDIIVDERSNKPGEQAFEVSIIFESPWDQLLIWWYLFLKKLISGRYLGEIMRLVICELIDEGVLFLGQNTYKLENQYVFDSAFLSLMEGYVGNPYFFHNWHSKLTSCLYSDPTDELLMIIGIFSHFFAVETTLAERQFFRALAKLIGRRAARLSSCGIAAIVSKMGYLDEGCHVGADGSLYNVMFPCLWRSLLSDSSAIMQKYPGFADRIHEGLVDIFGEKGRFVLVSSFHSSNYLISFCFG